jgi:hypothetical protein
VVSVIPTTDSATGAITKMNLVSKFGNKSNPQDKNNWPPLRVWLAEMLGVPAPVRAVVRQPTGRIAAPQLGTSGAVNGVITGSLEAHLSSLGPIRGAVEAIQVLEAALDPAGESDLANQPGAMAFEKLGAHYERIPPRVPVTKPCEASASPNMPNMMPAITTITPGPTIADG